MATKRLSTVSVDYKTMLGKMSVTERLRLAQSQDGPSILANVDPSQLPGLFPRYYQERLPDVGKALKSVMSEEFKPLSRREANQQMSVDQLDKSGSKFDPSTGKKTSTVAAKEKLANLSDEQKKVYEELKNGQVSADDPRLKFLEKLSPEDLKKAGIEKITGEDGKLSYKGTQISEAEVVEDLKNRTAGTKGGTLKQNQQEAYAAARQEGLSDSAAKILVANLSGEGLHVPQDVHPDPSGSNPNQKAHGIAQWDQNRAARIKDRYGQYPQEMTVAQQTKAAIWEMKTHYGKSWRDLNDENLTTEQRMNTVVGDFERPKDVAGGVRNRMGHLKQMSVQEGTIIPTGAEPTPEQITARKGEMGLEREKNLALSVQRNEGQKQDYSQRNNNTDPQSRERATTGQNIYTAGDSIGVGVGQSNRTPSVAQGGLMFTDPRMVQQLKNVPQGSTVQLYAGTNDAASNRLDSKAYEARMAELKQIAEERGLNVSIHGPHQSTGKKWSGNVGTVNQILGDSARNNGFRYVDNSSVTADAQDGVHMSKRAYQDLYTRGMPQPEPQTGEPIPAMAEGGETDVNEGEIKALPIGAMKNDNSVVVDKDSKPLFTMNTKEESANYDPDTGKVSVDPNATNNNAKKDNDGGQELSLDQQSTFKQSQVPIPESSGMSSFDTTLTLTDNMFKDPSFHRAMSRARFDISGDSASGNHFSSSATVS